MPRICLRQLDCSDGICDAQGAAERDVIQGLAAAREAVLAVGTRLLVASPGDEAPCESIAGVLRAQDPDFNDLWGMASLCILAGSDGVHTLWGSAIHHVRLGLTSCAQSCSPPCSLPSQASRPRWLPPLPLRPPPRP